MQSVWDTAVQASLNGTFLHMRSFMDYHADRYADASLLLVSDAGRPLAVLPACRCGDSIVSHAGLTYGGLLTTSHLGAAETLEACRMALEAYRQSGAARFQYKPVPHIYHRHPCEADVYAFTRLGARLTARSLSAAIDLTAPLGLSELRRRKVRRARAAGVTASLSDNTSLPRFWSVLTDVLHTQHGRSPVHTLAEMQLLQSRFPTRISLHTACLDGCIVAGTLVFETSMVAHAQYIAADDTARACGALDLLFETVIAHYAKAGKRYFDFGISTDHSGQQLNAGLVFQKEGFGARGICYDEYTLDLCPTQPAASSTKGFAND